MFDNTNESFVVVIEYDIPTSLQHLRRKGPLVMETYLKNSSLAEARERQRRIGDRYGRSLVAKLVPVLEEV